MLLLVEEKTISTSDETTRTAATVYKNDLDLMKILARLKFDKDPVNSAWKEAIKLFNQENKHLLKEKYDEISDE